MAYINVYNNNPTTGGTDGNAVSQNGAQTNPVSVTLDASISQSDTVKLALRCDSGYQTVGNTTIAASGTTASSRHWATCLTRAKLPIGTASTPMPCDSTHCSMGKFTLL